MSRTSKQPSRYRCENPACTLGARGVPGHFTGGITAHQVNVLTGKPVDQLDPAEFGEGVCPNCGERGAKEEAV